MSARGHEEWAKTKLPGEGVVGMKASGIVALAFLALALPARATHLPPQHDPYCPDTDKPVSALVSSVAKSPHVATTKMGDQATAIYKSYERCGDQYMRKGQLGKLVYAIAQAAGMYDFAVHAYYKTNHIANARRAAEDGVRSINLALHQPRSSELTRYMPDLEHELALLNDYIAQLRYR
jgi:hypothetical protein